VCVKGFMVLFLMKTEPNASGLVYNAPEKSLLEIAPGREYLQSIPYRFPWRGNYLNVLETNRFTVKGSFGFNFRETIPAIHTIFCLVKTR
jgi:hypothetical protein